MWLDDDEDVFAESIEAIEVTVADVTDHRDDLTRENRALEPVKQSLVAAGFYTYGTFDEQQRWTMAVDDELGHVGISVGGDGFHIELWATSPGMYSDEDNDWRRKAHERLARMTIPNIARGMLAPHQSAYWDGVEHGVGVRVQYELPFTRAPQIGAFVREHLPELEDLLTMIESNIAS